MLWTTSGLHGSPFKFFSIDNNYTEIIFEQTTVSVKIKCYLKAIQAFEYSIPELKLLTST
jgi:hypothetical protein